MLRRPILNAGKYEAPFGRSYCEIASLLLLFSTMTVSGAPEAIGGDARIHANAGNSEIVIKTTSRVAGAIDSLSWKGKEFIDSFDHGRQLQSASNFDLGQPFFPETFNPTEAGSRVDGRGERSSSRLIHLKSEGNVLETKNRMAFWLQPGEKSNGRAALNDKILSNHFVAKRVRIGYKTFPHAIEYDVVFTVPKGEHHTYAQFEALTAYMPAEFSHFWKFNVHRGDVEKLGDGPGEQNMPIIFSTGSGSHAMGIFSPAQPSNGFDQAGYGRWRFKDERVVKWNCVFRISNPKGIESGDYAYKCIVIVGDLEEVKTTQGAVIKEFKK